jgi:putative copper export protein
MTDLISLLPLVPRALVIIALTLMVGGFAFNLLVLRGEATTTLRAAAHPRRLGWLMQLVGLAAVVSVLDYATRAQVATPQTVLQVLVRLAPFGVLGWLVLTQRADTALALAVCALALLNQSLTSHAAYEREPVLPLLTDWVHLTFVSIWLGGVAYFAIVIVPIALQEPTRLPALGTAITRFSPIAMLCVLVIAITGIIQSSSFVGSLDVLIGTAYGRTLLVKFVLFLALLGFGAFHQFVLGPQLNAWRAKAESQAQVARRLRVTIAIEALVSVLPLIAAAVMTLLPLARDAL